MAGLINKDKSKVMVFYLIDLLPPETLLNLIENIDLLKLCQNFFY